MNEIEQFFDRIAPTYGIHSKRDDALILSLIEKIGIKKNDKVMDVGCGKGVISLDLYNKSQRQVLAMDLSGNMIRLAKEKNIEEEKVKFLHEDFYLTDEKGYDAIVFFDCYPHFIDREGLKKKILDVLVSHGRFAILHDLSRKSLSSCHGGLNDHLSRELLSSEEEADFYLPEFSILKMEETERSYSLIMEKRA